MNETEPMYKFYIIIALEITVKLTIKTRNSSERLISSSSYSQLSIDASTVVGHGMQLGDVIMRGRIREVWVGLGLQICCKRGERVFLLDSLSPSFLLLEYMHGEQRFTCTIPFITTITYDNGVADQYIKSGNG